MSDPLYLLVNRDNGQKVLVDKDILIGRDKSCGVVLEQGHASRQHAKLSPHREGIQIEDLKSTNGTVVNGNKITQPVVLKEGDELVIGRQHFTASRAGGAQNIDADATMLFTGEATVKDTADALAQSQSGPAYEDTIPETPVPPDERASQSVGGKNLADSNAPPSWVLSNQQAVDGTKFIDKKSMQDVLQRSTGAVKEKVDFPTLIGNTDPIAGMRFQLTGQGAQQWEIGRAPTCQVMINHDSVSSGHAQIINESGRWKLIDLMSANGTYVNGKKGLSSYLSSGDVLRFGRVECTFNLPESMAKKAAKKIVVKEQKKSGGMLKTALIAFVVTGIVAVAVIAGLSLLN